MDKRLLIGIGSGLVSGLILASAGGGTVPGFIILFFLSPLPVAITGLAWGWFAALAAALSAAGVLTIGIAPKTGLVHFLAIGAPVSFLAYLILLHRERAPEPSVMRHQHATVEWYPLGRVLAAIGLIGGGLATIALLAIASTPEQLEAAIRKTAERLFSQAGTAPGAPKTPLSPTELDRFTKLMTIYFGSVLATTWMTLAIFNLWAGGHVARASNLLQRPWPDLSSIRAPRELAIVFAVAVLASFLPGYTRLIAASFASAIMMVYMVIGLAIVHNTTRGNDYRALILVITYVGLVFLQPFSGFLLAMFALAEPYLPFRRQGPFDVDLPPPPPR